MARSLVVRIASWSLPFAGLVLACALPLDGQAPESGASSSDDASASPDVSRADAANPDAFALVDAPLSDGCAAPPPGWTYVGYGGAGGATCPAGSSTVDFVENPTAPNGACSCTGCVIVTHQSCAAGAFATFYDVTPMNANCLVPGLPYAPANGSCYAIANTSLGNHFKATPPAPSGTGSCALASVGNASAVTTTPARACVPSSVEGCDFPGLATCVQGAGDRTCPAGYPNKHSVGTKADLQCGACGCNVTTTCKGTLVLSGASDCSGGVTLDVDNSCKGVQPGGNYNHAKYTGTIATEGCAAPAQPTQTLALSDAQTICCP